MQFTTSFNIITKYPIASTHQNIFTMNNSMTDLHKNISKVRSTKKTL